MIIDKEIEMIISSSNYRYYKELGYNFTKVKDSILVKIEDLSKGSKVRVNCKCDYCENIINIVYKNYIKQIEKLEKYCCTKCSYKKRSELCKINWGVEHTLQLDWVKNERFKTNIEKYGGKSPFSNSIIINKAKKTLSDKYGFDNPFQIENIKEKIKETNISNKRWSSDNNFSKYRRRVKSLTSKNKKELFLNWSGYDYYDGQFIKENLKLDKNNELYPTIDHKISTLYGFINKIPPEEISNIDNLCITKRSINSSKNSKIESEFSTNKSLL